MLAPELKFIDSGSASTFEELCRELNGDLKNDTIILNNNVWKGIIKKVEVEPGLYIHFWNCSLLSLLLLKHEPAGSTIPTSYNLVYSLTPDVFSFKSESNGHNNGFIQGSADTFCTTNQTKAYFELAPNDHLKVIFISITEEWVHHYFSDIDKTSTGLILPFHINSKPLLVFDSTDKDEYLLANDIADHLQTAQPNHLHIHSRTLLLILQFFNKYFTHRRQEKNKKIKAYYDKLKMTENILSAHLSGKLPSLKEIAEKVQMNETALKRYFKLLYGKNIYEYYLQKKMDQAKRMLIQDDLNVNEVALHLGYEKTTNFIDIFKKHFGYSPGTIRKNPMNKKG